MTSKGDNADDVSVKCPDKIMKLQSNLWSGQTHSCFERTQEDFLAWQQTLVNGEYHGEEYQQCK